MAEERAISKGPSPEDSNAMTQVACAHSEDKIEPSQPTNVMADHQEPGSQYTNLQWLFVVLAVYSSALFYGLDTTIVAVIQGPVTLRFNNVDKIGWLGIGFPLGSIATIAAWSKAYAIFDTKWMYIGSLVHFAAGSTLCGAAPDMNSLIVGRVWAGAGGAGMYLGQLNIWSTNVSMERRSLYISGGGIVWGLGCVLGPLVGGAFADSEASWRWAFYINLVLFAIFTPVYFFVLRSHMPGPKLSLVKRLQELDWLGIILNSGMYTAFVIGFAIGGTLWPWHDGRTVGTIVAFGVILLAFALQQRFTIMTTKENRIFPVRFLTRRTFLLLFTAQTCVQTALAVPLYYIPLFFQFARNETAVTSAVRLLPFVIINIIAVFTNGALLPRFGFYPAWYFGSGILNTIGGALFFGLLTPRTSAGAVYGYSIVLALGSGLAQQAAYSIAAVKAPDYVSDAIGFINLAQVGAVVIALTFASLIFQNIGYRNVKSALVGLNVDSSEIRAALGGASSRVFDDGFMSEQVRSSVEKGIVDAIRWSFLMIVITGIINIAAALCMKRETLFNSPSSESLEETGYGHCKQAD